MSAKKKKSKKVFSTNSLMIKLLDQVNDLKKPLVAVYNGESDHMQTFDLSKATIEHDNSGNPYILLPKPTKE